MYHGRPQKGQKGINKLRLRVERIIQNRIGEENGTKNNQRN